MGTFLFFSSGKNRNVPIFLIPRKSAGLEPAILDFGN